jgi:Na+/proline symporter
MSTPAVESVWMVTAWLGIGAPVLMLFTVPDTKSVFWAKSGTESIHSRIRSTFFIFMVYYYLLFFVEERGFILLRTLDYHKVALKQFYFQ